MHKIQTKTRNFENMLIGKILPILFKLQAIVCYCALLF